MYFLCFALLAIASCLTCVQAVTEKGRAPQWLVNVPPEFERRRNNTNLARFAPTDILSAPGYDKNVAAINHMQDILVNRKKTVNGFVDGELIDALEHFFWGLKGGIAIEIGALDGTWKTHSQTEDLEDFGWKRILVEGNPKWRNDLVKNSPAAFGVIGVICKDNEAEGHRVVHFDPSAYTGGILEFMSKPFLKSYHKPVWDKTSPEGDLSSVKWDDPDMAKLKIEVVDCVPMHAILKRAHVDHINFFILDVEGGELEVLETINWKHTTFDVLCIETEKINRPEGFEGRITDFLSKHGYKVYTHAGRNTWYIHKDFVPSSHPDSIDGCFDGCRGASLMDMNWVKRRKDKLVPCKDLPSGADHGCYLNV
jgi:hypothetical protein